MTDLFRAVATGYYHGVMHCANLNMLAFRMPKCACSTLRKFFHNTSNIVTKGQFQLRTDWKNDGMQFTDDYEIFENLKFEDTKEYFDHPALVEKPLVIFVRDPYERLVSGMSEFIKVAGTIPGDPLNDEVFRKLYGHYNEKTFVHESLYRMRPILFEQQLESAVNLSNGDLLQLYKSLTYNPTNESFIKDNHLTPYSYWLEPLQNIQQEIVYFDVDDHLTENFNHFLISRGITEHSMHTTRNNNSRDNSYQMFIKNYLKPLITNSQVVHPYRQQAKEIYRKDIELYESLRPKFYRGGQDLQQNHINANLIRELVQLEDDFNEANSHGGAWK